MENDKGQNSNLKDYFTGDNNKKYYDILKLKSNSIVKQKSQ